MKNLSTRWLLVLLALSVAPAFATGAERLPISAAPVQAARAADIDDLQQRAEALSAALDDVRRRDPARADTLQDELDELNDEIAYLRVTLRKKGELSSRELTQVGDRLADLELRVKGQQVPSSGATGSRRIPVGQEIDVRLRSPLSSETAEVEDRFEATTLVDLSHGEDVLVPAGSVMGGVVSSVDRATRTDRTGRLTLAFDTLTVDDETHKIRASVTNALESEGIKGEIGRTTAGAVAGAIIGGILGGGKGALAGLVIGGGGTILATPGKNVELDAGTVLRVRFDSPVEISK